MKRLPVIMFRLKTSAILILAVLFSVSLAKAQKWQPGTFTDIKGNKVTGLIQENPSGKGPIKDEVLLHLRTTANPIHTNSAPAI